MKFYNLKTRSYVEVPDSAVKKMKVVRRTKSGQQTRYILTADYQGYKLRKFVTEATFNSYVLFLEGDSDTPPPKSK